MRGLCGKRVVKQAAFPSLTRTIVRAASTVGDYLDDVRPGEVVVLDNGGRANGTVWGDILTTIAHARDIAGDQGH